MTHLFYPLFVAWALSSSLDDEILRFFLTTVLTGDDSGLRDLESNKTLLTIDLL